jgi:hypothetical protein
MNTNHNKLALRRQSIRTLTADELSMAHGGGNGTGGGGGTTTKHTTVPTTGTHRPTLTSTDLPPQTVTIA